MRILLIIIFILFLLFVGGMIFCLCYIAHEAAEIEREREDKMEVKKSNDLISRQAAINALENTDCELSSDTWDELTDAIMSLPSAQPERTEYFPNTIAIPSQYDCVCLSEKVIATFFDVEHEEWTQQTVTIADVLDSVCDDYTVLPSAQPEIIACGDCKHWICHDKRCGYWNHGVKPLMWCSEGERRENG